MRQRFFHSFVAEPEPQAVKNRARILGMGIAFVFAQVWLFFTRPSTSSSDPYRGFVVPIALILNQIAYSFFWERRTTLVLRLLAWTWILVGFLYILLTFS